MERLGKYEIRGILGRGAMGTVYEGWDPHIARRVAIKTVRLPDKTDSEERELLGRFQQEAQAAGRLQHPNIVGVFDYAETDELAYIVMEFVDGRTLKSVLDDTGLPDLDETGRLMDGLLEGLDYSHGNQVIHRDIKPANIIRTQAGGVKIADFGIARIGGSSMTLAGTIMGTPAYMSPEQFKGIDIDSRSDIYSAGVVLFQLLTGKRPFEGSMATIMHAVLNDPVPPPSSLADRAPTALDPVVARAMARQPEDRYQTAGEMNRALQDALRGTARAVIAGDNRDTDPLAGLGVRDGRPDVLAPGLPDPLSDPFDDDATMVRGADAAPAEQAMQPPVPRAPTGAATGTEAPPRKSRMGLVLASAVGLLLIAGGGAYVLTRGGAERTDVALNDRTTPPREPAQPPVPLPAPEPAKPEAVAPPPAPAEPPRPSSVPAPAGLSPPAEPPRPQIETPALVPAVPFRPQPIPQPQPERVAPSPAPHEPPRSEPPRPEPPRPTPTPQPADVPTPPSPVPAEPPRPQPSRPDPSHPTPAPQAEPTQPTPAPQPTPPPTPQPRPLPPPQPEPQPQRPAPPPAEQPRVQTQPPPPPPPPPPPEPVAPRALPMPAILATVRRAPCTAVTAEERVSGTATISGVAGPDAGQRLRDAVQSVAPGAAIEWKVLTATGPYCGLLDLIRPLQRGGDGDVGVSIPGATPVMTNGELIIPQVSMPDGPAHLQLDYASSDGSVLHMHQAAPGPAYPAGATPLFGRPDPATRFNGWEVADPFGTDLIVGIASSIPLLRSPRPQIEELAAYERDLRAALEAASRAGARLSATVLVLRTADKR